MAVVGVAADGRDEAIDHRLEQRAAGARGRADPTSSWSNSARDGNAVDGSAPASASTPPSTTRGCRAGPTPARCRRAEHRRWCEVVEHEVPGRDVGDVGARRRATRRRSRPRPGPSPRSGVRCCLLVEHEPAVVDVAVEVDGELRDPGERRSIVTEPQCRRQRRGVRRGRDRGRATSSPARRRRPRRRAGASRRRRCRGGLDPQVRRVGVSADHAKRRERRRRRAAPRHERATAHDVTRSGLRRPRAGRATSVNPARQSRRRPGRRRGTARARRRGRRRVDEAVGWIDATR